MELSIVLPRNNRVVGRTVYKSEVKEKKEAQKKYDQAKKKGQTAGQVKQK